ncbi:GIY-YIG nuclease family protein [Marinigracilibium pacificum]|uniref:GIY-YIG nuclease family protein n=1 Tax=Marinigracilibium pacificum TaxID=2729599 RepID=A0A848J2B7_9BACT|nr:GIY-YIG nuclease family protein [Marinigracilibium pacificum]NMM50737.1 GIY-YIG nuclease family protein [Marinigracilibium pacificum]
MERGGYVYILTNKYNTVLYIGVTSDIYSRIYEHKNSSNSGSFSKRYKLQKVIYYEYHPSIEEAIEREKVLKKWRREKKSNLINRFNPKWQDLWIKIKDDYA